MEDAPAPPPRRRLRKILIVSSATLGALLLVFLIGAPVVIASVLKSQLVATLEKKFDATATLGGASFSWGGTVTLSDLNLRDRSGQPLASVKSVVASVPVMDALRGKFSAEVKIDAPRLDLRRGSDGRLNLTAAMKPDTGPPAPPSEPTKIPDVRLKFTVTGAVLAIAGEKEATEITASGTLAVAIDQGRFSGTGSFEVNGGAATLKFNVDPQVASTGDAAFERVRLDSKLSPLLEFLHPAFAVAGGKLDGAAFGSLDVHHAGPLSAGELSVKGKLEVRDCEIGGSPLLGDLLGALPGGQREIRLKPVEFRIEKGRIVYDRPWQWTIAGADTTFKGSIGLDRTLDLTWSVPVTDELVSRVPALKASRGKTLEAPIRGTVSRPKLDAKKFAQQAAEDKLEETARKGLDDLLGGKDEKKAEKLLEEADALHAAGKTAEAVAKYRKIKDDYRKSRVYKDNRTRIDDRAK